MMRKRIDEKYLYSELSHEIIGSAFDVHNSAGAGRPEKTYQQLLAREFNSRDINHCEQKQIDLIYKGEVVGKRRVDFLVQDKIIVELKVGSHIGQSEIAQLYDYLKIMNLKLGLIITFSNEVKVRRIVNLY